MSNLEELQKKYDELGKEIELLKQKEKEENKYFDFSNLRISFLIEYENQLPKDFSRYSIEVRDNGEYEKKGFYLTDLFNWEIVKDSQGELVLLPTKK